MTTKKTEVTQHNLEVLEHIATTYPRFMSFYKHGVVDGVMYTLDYFPRSLYEKSEPIVRRRW